MFFWIFAAGSASSISGWGSAVFFLAVVTDTDEDCGASYAALGGTIVPELMLSAGEKRYSACKGDSTAP